MDAAKQEEAHNSLNVNIFWWDFPTFLQFFIKLILFSIIYVIVAKFKFLFYNTMKGFFYEKNILMFRFGKCFIWC